jgi:hypothetical protein
LINETYSAFVQGFMPTLARPEVDVLEGLTTAIIVDQERALADIVRPESAIKLTAPRPGRCEQQGGTTRSRCASWRQGS